jgi:hypothetical protein
MKIKLILAVILLSTTVQAHLIDLTPGGYTGVISDEETRLSQQIFLDEAIHGWVDFPFPEGRTYLNGWVSRFGRLNGADYFHTNLFQVADISTAFISWDLSDEPSGLFLTTIRVWGLAPDVGLTSWTHLYRVSHDQRFTDLNGGFVTLHEGVTIYSIAFYGLERAPDAGSTILLFGLALAILITGSKFHGFERRV